MSERREYLHRLVFGPDPNGYGVRTKYYLGIRCHE
jgi:hypothetical protein